MRYWLKYTDNVWNPISAFQKNPIVVACTPTEWVVSRFVTDVLVVVPLL